MIDTNTYARTHKGESKMMANEQIKKGSTMMYRNESASISIGALVFYVLGRWFQISQCDGRTKTETCGVRTLLR